LPISSTKIQPDFPKFKRGVRLVMPIWHLIQKVAQIKNAALDVV